MKQQYEYEAFMYEDDSYEDYGEYPVHSIEWWEQDEFKYCNAVLDDFDWEYDEQDGQVNNCC